MSTTTPEPEPGDLVASVLPDLLLLLADVREQWERASRDLGEAELRAERATVRVGDLEAELDLIADQLRVAQARQDMTQEYADGLAAELERLREAEDERVSAVQAERDQARRAHEGAEAEIQQLRSGLEAANSRERETREHLETLLASTSWRATRPLRALTDVFRRPGIPPAGPT